MLMRGRQHDRAELALNEVLTPTFQQNPQSAPLLRSRAELLARGRRWQEASADLRKLLGFAIKEPEPYLMLAATLVAGGDLQSYQELRRKSLELFAQTSDPTAAHDIAMAYLILPSSEAGLETAAKMAQSALDHNYPGRAWWFLPGTNCFRFVRGLAEYRQGHFTEAVALIQNVLADSGEDFFRCAEAWVVLAMARQQSNQGDEAREALAKSVEIVDGKLQGLECTGVDLGGRGLYWVDWIITHALLDEARGLIEYRNTSNGKP
jgi:tetratricopeptide (TPR) repeat protein